MLGHFLFHDIMWQGSGSKTRLLANADGSREGDTIRNCRPKKFSGECNILRNGQWKPGPCLHFGISVLHRKKGGVRENVRRNGRHWIHCIMRLLEAHTSIRKEGLHCFTLYEAIYYHCSSCVKINVGTVNPSTDMSALTQILCPIFILISFRSNSSPNLTSRCTAVAPVYIRASYVKDQPVSASTKKFDVLKRVSARSRNNPDNRNFTLRKRSHHLSVLSL